MLLLLLLWCRFKQRKCQRKIWRELIQSWSHVRSLIAQSSTWSSHCQLNWKCYNGFLVLFAACFITIYLYLMNKRWYFGRKNDRLCTHARPHISLEKKTHSTLASAFTSTSTYNKYSRYIHCMMERCDCDCDCREFCQFFGWGFSVGILLCIAF